MDHYTTLILLSYFVLPYLGCARHHGIVHGWYTGVVNYYLWVDHGIVHGWYTGIVHDTAIDPTITS
jgi:hypothetical protein